MSSHLTPLVFRQVLRGRPLTHRQCVGLVRTRQWALKPSPVSVMTTEARSFFNWGGKKKKKVIPLAKAKRVDQGFTELVRLDELLRMNVRPLEPETVNRAFAYFFKGKNQTGASLTEQQIHLALVALRHLLALERTISSRTIPLALQALCRRVGNAGDGEALELARLLYETSKGKLTPEEDFDAARFETDVTLQYIRVLCSCHKGHEARTMLDAALRNGSEAYRQGQFWEPVLEAFVADKNDVEIANTGKILEDYGVPLSPDSQLSILKAFVHRDDFAAAQQWHRELLKKSPTQNSQADAIFLDICIQHRRLKEGEEAFRRLLDHEPDKPTWDMILRWAAAQKKGADEVERMMEVMVKRNKAANVYDRPDADTINGLISLANSMKDPYQAERYIALADKRGIHLNGKTYVLQMEYRLDVGDLPGAFKAFQQMLSNEVDDDSDLPQINRLVQKLYDADEPDTTQIKELLAVLDERRSRYEPATIVALCRFRLQHDQIRSLIDLLHVHAYNLSQDQRQPIMDVFLRFILDRNTSVKASWDAYCILREIFKELDTAARTKIMIDYFARGRSDVAIHVFGHMRQAEIKADRPSAKTYALCFQGLGHAGDERSFDLVYNMLKLDSEIEPDTHLRNAIMLAQIGCGFKMRALEIWDDIAFSREGPTYNSIVIALYAVETTDRPTNRGQRIWAQLEEYGVRPTKPIWVAYIGALAGQGKLEEAFERVEGMQGAVGEAPGANTLGVLYNAAFDSSKDQVKAWAAEKYPAELAELETLGMNDEGLYKINRQLTP